MSAIGWRPGSPASLSASFSLAKWYARWAERAIKSAIEKGALMLGGCPLMGAMATASVIREIPVLPEASEPPVRPGHHVLETHNLTLGQRLDAIGADPKKVH